MANIRHMTFLDATFGAPRNPFAKHVIKGFITGYFGPITASAGHDNSPKTMQFEKLILVVARLKNWILRASTHLQSHCALSAVQTVAAPAPTGTPRWRPVISGVPGTWACDQMPNLKDSWPAVRNTRIFQDLHAPVRANIGCRPQAAQPNL